MTFVYFFEFLQEGKEKRKDHKKEYSDENDENQEIQKAPEPCWSPFGGMIRPNQVVRGSVTVIPKLPVTRPCTQSPVLFRRYFRYFRYSD